MTLVDTSAWVEYLRGTGSDAHHEVRDLLAREAPLFTTDVVVMEVLAGARTEDHAAELRRLLLRCEFVPVHGLAAHEEAASLFRHCRRAGRTVRRLTDCLIGAVAIRHDLPVLHVDADFEALAACTSLRIHGIAGR